MRAIIYERRGPARDVLQIVDRPKPEPDAGEVRVQVAVTAINPTDLKARGQWLGQEDMLFPVVTPHRDAAGIIEKVGATGWTMHSPWLLYFNKKDAKCFV